jgi:protein gp37
MSEHSKIEWTDATWNPLRGCTKISPGCKHCYAETFAERFRGVAGHPYQQGFDLRFVPEKLAEPFQWSSARMVFVNSMSDLFQPGVSDAYIEAVAGVMVEAYWHTYQVLTKRSGRLLELLSSKLLFAAKQKHIWWGVSVEDKRYGLPRVEHLRQSPAAIKFLSIEPLLEDIGNFNITGIDWAIVGGESGRGARPMEQAWVERILSQAREADVAFFFKQWGGVQKSTTGRILHGRTYDEMPRRISTSMPSKNSRVSLASKWHNKARQWLSEPAARPIVALEAAGA